MKPGSGSVKDFVADSRLLTDFPQARSELLVVVEASRKLIAMIKYSHQAQEVISWQALIHFLALEQIPNCLYQQQLKHAFHNDLLEYPPPVGDRVHRFAVFGVTNKDG